MVYLPKKLDGQNGATTSIWCSATIVIDLFNYRVHFKLHTTYIFNIEKFVSDRFWLHSNVVIHFATFGEQNPERVQGMNKQHAQLRV